MLTWEEYTYDMYLEKDVFVLTGYFAHIWLRSVWYAEIFFKLEWMYLKILNLDHTEFAKFDLQNSLPLYFSH